MERRLCSLQHPGGSGFGKTLERLEDSAPGAAEIMEGVMLNGEKSKEELKDIVEEYFIKKYVKNRNLGGSYT